MSSEAARPFRDDLVRKAGIAILVGLIVAAAAAEIGLRYLGITDFPLYENSRQLGYIPRPNQHGVYLGKYRWAFNELSMGVADTFNPGAAPRNILIIGDSNVMGLNTLDQATRLGPVMNAACPRVWPVGADSWAFLNELRYLRLHENLLSSFDRIIFVLNFGDFGDASVWSSEISNPTHTPVSSLVYLMKKLMPAPAEPAPTGDNDWRSAFAWLKQRYSGPITVALYPVRAETADPHLRTERLDVRKQEIGSGPTFVDLYEAPGWSVNEYRDQFHSTADGTAKLAAYIVANTPECHRSHE